MEFLHMQAAVMSILNKELDSMENILSDPIQERDRKLEEIGI